MGETDAERRLRIRDEVEEADHELTEELLAGTAAAEPEVKIVQSMEGYKLKSMKDHIVICTDLAERFNGSKAKLSLTHDLFLSLYMNIDLDNIEHLQDAINRNVVYRTQSLLSLQ